MNSHPDILLDRISDFVRERSRLSFTGPKRAMLKQKLSVRLSQLHLPDLAGYWELLHGDDHEESRLYDLITINETSFFRNMAQFTALKSSIFPELLSNQHHDTRSLRILSVGCATGEEPYSCAMTLLDVLGDPAGWCLEILAGDLSETCLQTARAGFYEQGRLTGLPDGYRDRFMMVETGGARVRDEVRRLVRFTRLNLHDLMCSELPSWHIGLGLFDIVLCRNVMIYFAAACQQQLVDTLFKLIRPGGYLLTGDAEPLHLFRHRFETVDGGGCLIYRKTRRRDDVGYDC